MKFTIRTLLFLTAIAALSASVLRQSQRLARANEHLANIQIEINGLIFEEAYVDAHTRACELAIANNPLPSPYYIDAKRHHEEMTRLNEEERK